MTIATLAQVKREMKAKKTITEVDDIAIIEYIYTITARIEKKLGGMSFEPMLETRKFTANGATVNSRDNTLWLKAPILQLIGLNSDGAAVDVNSGLASITGSYGHKDGLTLKLSGGSGWYPADPYAEETVEVTALYGFRSGYPRNGWHTSRDKLLAMLNDTEDVLTVTNPAGIDYRGMSPRFSIGNLLRVVTGDAYEFMEVIATDPDSDPKTVTVNRGARGTTAIAHAINDVIEVWYPEEDILHAVERVPGLYYARRGAFEQATVSDLATVIYPSDLPAEVYGVLQNYT